MLKSAAHAMFVFATIAALPATALAQFGLGAHGTPGCTDDSCTPEQAGHSVAVQQGRPALFGGPDTGHGIGARPGGLLSGHCDVDGCSAGCSAVAYSLNGVDLYSYDRQDPWLHGQFVRIPGYGGYNSFRPYNYRHVLAQQEIAAARGGSRSLPYSQQFWNRERTKYLNRHLADVDPADDNTSTPATAASTPPAQERPTPAADVQQTVPAQMSATAQMVSMQDAQRQPVPARTVAAPGLPLPMVMRPRQSAMQQPMMQQPPVRQPVMQQPMMQLPVMQQPMIQQPVMQQPMIPWSMMQQPMMQQPVMTPSSFAPSNMLMMPQQGVASPQGFLPQQNVMQPPHATVPQPHMVIPHSTMHGTTSPMMMPAPHQNVMHQAGFRPSAEAAQPLIQSDTAPVAMEAPQPIHIYGSAILTSEPGRQQ